MGKKRMWNIVNSIERKEGKSVERLKRDRAEDEVRLEHSGLPHFRELIVDAEEFLSGIGQGQQTFQTNIEKNFFVAVIPKENIEEDLERQYRFGLNSFEKAVDFVKEFLLDKNKDQYNVKLKENPEVDLVGILILKENQLFFEIVYDNAIDKLNHGECSVDLWGHYDQKQLVVKKEGGLHLSKLKEEAIDLIKESFSILEEKGIKKGYFEILHIKNPKDTKIVFLNYLTTEAYVQFPPQMKKKEKQIISKDFLNNRLGEIVDEELRVYAREMVRNLELPRQ